MLGAVIAAAGLSSRMGDFKPLLPYRGKTILAATVEKLRAVGAKEIVIVAGHRHEEIRKYFKDSSLKIVYNPHYRERDMLYSLQCGIKNIKKAAAAFIMPADMPAISLQTFADITNAWQANKGELIIPVQNGRWKHPPLIGRRYFADIISFSGENGMRGILNKLEKKAFLIEISDDGLNVDVDTPEEYRRLLETEGYSEKL
ncbi:nucleotidyltransferase family protein [Pectinatus haikarae]|uniref:CTP:molybdopterin cytidylyltransferase MocA n=1 Tax=Pectinatus haikarae TaxID=349096 RepID=A0ABT9Y8S8_9FIRM|nr:nucleotidyltransferase family protein [Pectinatus haikarae]MDQ0204244.1 CTP:molybdopterin cytidylyltransferase MocA [Pectinatus haikarae]